jgi:hypothetical protein
MKSSESFKQTIQDYLTVRANTDEQFAVSFAKPGKNIDECCNFILNTVRETGCNGFDDDEIYGIAVHYYDEDELDPKYLKSISGTCVVNHQVKLPVAEIERLERKAREDYYNECLKKQRESNKQKQRKPVKQEVEQLSLF